MTPDQEGFSDHGFWLKSGVATCQACNRRWKVVQITDATWAFLREHALAHPKLNSRAQKQLLRNEMRNPRPRVEPAEPPRGLKVRRRRPGKRLRANLPITGGYD